MSPLSRIYEKIMMKETRTNPVVWKAVSLESKPITGKQVLFGPCNGLVVVAEIMLSVRPDTTGRRRTIGWKEEGRWVKHQVIAHSLDVETMVLLMLCWVQGLDKPATVRLSCLLIWRSVLVLMLAV